GPVVCGRGHPEAVLMPGILPSRASLRSMMRLMRNLRYTPRARPVSSHRRTMRLLNLGLRLLLATCALVAIVIFPQALGASAFAGSGLGAGSGTLAGSG